MSTFPSFVNHQVSQQKHRITDSSSLQNLDECASTFIGLVSTLCFSNGNLSEGYHPGQWS